MSYTIVFHAGNFNVGRTLSTTTTEQSPVGLIAGLTTVGAVILIILTSVSILAVMKLRKRKDKLETTVNKAYGVHSSNAMATEQQTVDYVNSCQTDIGSPLSKCGLWFPQ